MSRATESASQPLGLQPVWRLVNSLILIGIREPDTIFWLYCFPILLVFVLGTAFEYRPPQEITVDVQAGPRAKAVARALENAEEIVAEIHSETACRERLRVGRCALVVKVSSGGGYDYVYDPARPESVLARNVVNETLQQMAGRKDAVIVQDTNFDEPGGRYVDFLVPGLAGMYLMGGGIWGVGFVAVDFRRRKLLKCFLATPMRKSHFLAALIISRILFLATTVLLLLFLSWLMFDVAFFGSVCTVAFLTLLGSVMSAAIGLLLVCRLKTFAAMEGLSYLLMLPMWLFSGVFYSSRQFPDAAQPFIQMLPLTPLVNSLRAVMQEGAGLGSQMPEVGVLTAWTLVSFALALRWFRWTER